MTEFVERNGYVWSTPPDDPGGDQTVEMMVGIADGTVAVETLAEWVRQRMGTR